MSLLTVRDLALGYETGIILEGLSFNVDAGDFLCIVGENGSGKTTLMRTLLGLRQPSRGSIELGDGLKAGEIGYLPQQSLVQRDFPASVQEIVLSGCLARCGLRPFYSSDEKKIAEDSMKKMNILDLSKRCYRELSGGQQQRVLLARALCAARKLLILDEPVSGLDPRAAADMYELINSLHKEGVAIIMVTHDVSAVQYAEHVLHIGEDIFFGTLDEYLQSPNGRLFLRKEASDAC